MIRWNYALPRLLLLGLVGVAVWLGLNPALHWLLVSSGESVLQAKVEVGRVETSLLNAEIQLSDIAIANPAAPETNLLEADQLTLTLDTNALLRRKLVVRQARASGVQIDTERTTSGQLDSRSTSALRLGVLFPGEELTELGGAWLDQFADAMGDRLEDEVRTLESVQLVDELLLRWPAEYDQMEDRIDRLRARAAGIHELFQARSGNVLDDITAYQQAMREVDQVLREIDAIQREVVQLPDRVQRDRDALAAAQRRDVERIRGRLQLDGIDGQTISEYLLGPELGEQVATIADWLAWVRQYSPQQGEAPTPTRASGIDVLFSGIQKRPDYVIQALSLDGRAEIGGRPFLFTGEMRNLTSHPSLLGKPVQVQAQLTGRTTFRVQAELDRTGNTPHDHIVFDCPDIRIDSQLLGRRDQLALRVTPGSTHLWASLDVVGDQLEGQIVLKQESVELIPQVADRLGGQAMADRLKTVADAIQSVEVSLVVSGRADKPEWEFKSNLGPQLVDGLNHLARQELEARGKRVADEAFRQVDDQLAQFEQLLRQRRDAVLNKLEMGGSEFDELSRMIAGRLRMAPPDEILTRRLPSQIRLRL